jgi:hypothetical protein
MLAINLISVGILIMMLVYIIVFFVRYKEIPQSLSVTAEYPDQYHYWQVTICTAMGWMGYYYPVIYYNQYGLLTLIAVAGTYGLGLAGYFSYNPGTEKPRDLKIHKIGSFTGAILIMVFYTLIGDYSAFVILGVCAFLGWVIRGHRYGNADSFSNSIVFFSELAIIITVGIDIITKLIDNL